MSMTDDEVLAHVKEELETARKDHHDAIRDLKRAEAHWRAAHDDYEDTREALHVARGVLTRVEWARRVKGQK